MCRKKLNITGSTKYLSDNKSLSNSKVYDAIYKWKSSQKKVLFTTKFPECHAESHLYFRVGVYNYADANSDIELT